MKVRATLALVGAFLCGCPGPEPRDPTLTALRTQVFEPRCNFSACHGGADPQRGLDLENDPHGALVNVDSVEDPAVKRVLPGDPDASLLFQVLTGGVGSTEQMPPGVVLPDEDVEHVRAWIAAGALDN